MEEYPTVDDFEELYQTDFQLSAINYKQFSDFYSLSAIQLVFSSGVQTPLFASNAAQWDELKTIEIDIQHTIKYISLRYNQVAYEGLRLYDEEQLYILDQTWHQ